MSDKPKSQPPIDDFNGYFEFLNNDYPCWVLLQGGLYPSVTTAYQASRTEDVAVRKQIKDSETFEELAMIATKIKNPYDWSGRRFKVMEALVRDKFKRNKEIREKLVATGTRHLINTYQKDGDNETYWGMFKGAGVNSLGKILEAIRQEIKKGTDTERWLAGFSLEKDTYLLPRITLRVEKNNEAIEKLQLVGKPYHSFGKVNTNDFPLDHPSISRTHGYIVIDTNTNVSFIDFASSAGTFINGTKIEPLLPKTLNTNDVIVFGMSTRKYVVLIDTKEAEEYAKRRAEEVKKDLKQIQHLKKDGTQLSNEQIRSKIGFKINDCMLVENVPPFTSVRKLKEIFGEYARVKDINVCIDSKTGKEVGTAIIHFYSQKEVQEIIIKRIRFEISGRQLVLKQLDKHEATKLLQAHSLSKGGKQKRSRSRSRSRDKDRYKASSDRKDRR